MALQRAAEGPASPFSLQNSVCHSSTIEDGMMLPQADLAFHRTEANKPMCSCVAVCFVVIDSVVLQVMENGSILDLQVT